MKIGLIQCDDMHSSLREEYGQYPEMVANKFKEIDPNIEFATYLAHISQLPEDIDECDSYVITSGRFSAFDNMPWIASLSNFIVQLKRNQKKAIGIGFGHELMAKALGGKVERADSGWKVGLHTQSIVASSDFISPIVTEYKGIMLSEDKITELPPDVVVVAKSNCSDDVAMLLYGNYFVSIASHPEYSNDFAKAILNLKKDIVPAKRYDAAVLSLANGVADNSLVFSWFMNFLTDQS